MVYAEFLDSLGALDDVVDPERAPSGSSGRAPKTTRLIAATFTYPGAR